MYKNVLEYLLRVLYINIHNCFLTFSSHDTANYATHSSKNNNDSNYNKYQWWYWTAFLSLGYSEFKVYKSYTCTFWKSRNDMADNSITSKKTRHIFLGFVFFIKIIQSFIAKYSNKIFNLEAPKHDMSTTFSNLFFHFLYLYIFKIWVSSIEL